MQYRMQPKLDILHRVSAFSQTSIIASVVGLICAKAQEQVRTRRGVPQHIAHACKLAHETPHAPQILHGCCQDWGLMRGLGIHLHGG